MIGADYVTKPHFRLRSGRPKDCEKRHAIVEAAADLFAAEGFDAVTMDRVAAQAGVSKMTIYSHFGDKETLFERFLTSISNRMTDALVSKANAELGLSERLEATGRAFLAIVAGPLVPGMLLSIAAVRNNPALARRFYNAGPGRTRATLIALIEEYSTRGELIIDRAEWVADDLMGLWDGGLPPKMMFGVGNPLTPAEIKRRVGRAVDVFLRLYGVPTKAVALHL